jgi:hypothetical protein
VGNIAHCTWNSESASPQALWSGEYRNCQHIKCPRVHACLILIHSHAASFIPECFGPSLYLSAPLTATQAALRSLAHLPGNSYFPSPNPVQDADFMFGHKHATRTL